MSSKTQRHRCTSTWRSGLKKNNLGSEEVLQISGAVVNHQRMSGEGGMSGQALINVFKVEGQGTSRRVKLPTGFGKVRLLRLPSSLQSTTEFSPFISFLK